MTKKLEEQANELLTEYARSEGKSLRQLGIIDKRRQRMINEREIPMSSLMGHKRKKRRGQGDVERETE